MNNRNALKMNQQKIDADRKIKELEHKNAIEKMKYEEMRKICAEYITCIDPVCVRTGKYDFEKIINTCSQIALICGARYAQYAYNLQEMIVFCDELLPFHMRSPALEEEKINEKISHYVNFFHFFVSVTRAMLEGKDIPESTRWNLDDFEGSVPLDYRKLIS